MRLEPLRDEVVIERDEADAVSRGGVLIPDVAKQKPRYGRVVAAGPGRLAEDGTPIAMEVKVGDHVAFGAFAGTEVEFENKVYRIIREEDLIAVVLDEPEGVQGRGKKAG